MNKIFCDFFAELNWNELSAMKSNQNKPQNIIEFEKSFIFARELEKEINLILSTPEYVKDLLTTIIVQGKIIPQIREVCFMPVQYRVSNTINEFNQLNNYPKYSTELISNAFKWTFNPFSDMNSYLPEDKHFIKASCDCGASVTSFKDKHYKWCSIKSKGLL